MIFNTLDYDVSSVEPKKKSSLQHHRYRDTPSLALISSVPISDYQIKLYPERVINGCRFRALVKRIRIFLVPGSCSWTVPSLKLEKAHTTPWYIIVYRVDSTVRVCSVKHSTHDGLSCKVLVVTKHCKSPHNHHPSSKSYSATSMLYHNTMCTFPSFISSLATMLSVSLATPVIVHDTLASILASALQQDADEPWSILFTHQYKTLTAITGIGPANCTGIPSVWGDPFMNVTLASRGDYTMELYMWSPVGECIQEPVAKGQGVVTADLNPNVFAWAYVIS